LLYFVRAGGQSPKKLKCFSGFNHILLDSKRSSNANEAVKQTKQQSKRSSKANMAEVPQMFIDTLLNKLNEMKNLNMQTNEKRIVIIKQAYSMLLTLEGRALIKSSTRLRNVLIEKIDEFVTHPSGRNNLQFVGISERLKAVIAESNDG
jgi:hypothetical protein